MITTLTPAQEAGLTIVRERWLNYIFKYELLKEFNLEEATSAMKAIYKLSGLAEPRIEVYDSPMACQIAANKAHGNSVDNYVYYDFSSYINYSDFGWLSFFELFDEYVPEVTIDNKEDIRCIIAAVKQCFMSIQFDEVCYISKYPCEINRNAENNMHSTTRPGVAFLDGYCQHYINGRFLEEEIFNAAQNLDTAKEAFMASDNADVQAMVVSIVRENLGPKGVCDMLGAECIDEADIEHPNGYVEHQRLLRTIDSYSFAQDLQGNTNTKMAWNEMVCPSTKTTYMIPTDPNFTNVVDSAKSLRPKLVPTDLDYAWSDAN